MSSGGVCGSRPGERLFSEETAVRANDRSYTASIILCALAVSLCALLMGCRPIKWPEMGRPSEGLQVVGLSNRDVAALSSDDIVRIMRRAGFSDEQILKLGTELRNALLTSGAAQIKKGQVEAIYAVHGEYVFITTRLRGSFVYDLRRGKFGVMPSSPEDVTHSQY